MRRVPVDGQRLGGRQSPWDRGRGRAFTLIETLAVVALLAIAMTVGAVHLSGATRRARIEASLHTLALADSTARSAAMSGEPVRLSLAPSGEEALVSDRRSVEPI